MSSNSITSGMVTTSSCTISGSSISNGTIGTISPSTCTIPYTTTIGTSLPYTSSPVTINLDPSFSTQELGKILGNTIKASTANLKEPPAPYSFKEVIEYVPEKVYEFTFTDGTKVKTVREESDPFDLEYMFFLALAKKLYSGTLTFEGVLNKSYELQYEKKYIKVVRQGVKVLEQYLKNRQKEEEQKAIRKRQHERYVKRKQAAKQRKRKEKINIIAEAIRLSKEEE